MKQIICMKWGKKYPASFVNKLYGMVARNVSGEFRFVCLTDDSHGIRTEVECQPCPEIDINHANRNLPWRKVSLWGANPANLFGDWLFLDLDVVITAPIDDLFSYYPDKSFIVMYNWNQPGKDIGNTSVYRFRVGSHTYLLANLLNNPTYIFSQFPNSQTYISRSIKEIAFWPADWCILFKIQCVPPMPQRWWKTPELPTTAKVVAFPGAPNPDEAMLGHWPCIWYKKWYKHIQPSPWINKFWQE
jgi:hypothetical protein